MSVGGNAQGEPGAPTVLYDTWIYESQWRGSSFWLRILLQMIFLLMLLLCCQKGILPKSCCPGLGRMGLFVDRARILRVPRPAPLPNTCTRSQNVLTGNIQPCSKFLSAANEVVRYIFSPYLVTLLLSFKSYSMSLVYPLNERYSPLWKASGPSALQRWFASLQLST